MMGLLFFLNEFIVLIFPILIPNILNIDKTNSHKQKLWDPQFLRIFLKTINKLAKSFNTASISSSKQ